MSDLFGDSAVSWPLVEIDKVISFIRGITFKPEDQVEPFTEDSIVVMRTKNIQVEGLYVAGQSRYEFVYKCLQKSLKSIKEYAFG